MHTDKSIKKIFFLFFFSIISVLFVINGCGKIDEGDTPTPLDYEDTSDWILDHSDVYFKSIELGGTIIQIPEERVFSPSDKMKPVFRIPSGVITNKGSILVSCENRSEAQDKGEIDILVAKKKVGDTIWHIRKVLSHDSKSYGRYMNPVFVMDRMGCHEKKGRIYLFAAHMENPDYAVNQSAEEADMVYKYSDDDGKTWSPEKSIKCYWDTTQYSAIYPSSCNGVQAKDGTLFVPTMIVKNKKWRSGLLIKKPKGIWMFSAPTGMDGDNESSVYFNNNNQLILDCRTTEKIHRKYLYSSSDNSLSLLKESDVKVAVDLKAEITKVEFDTISFYLTTYVDSKSGERENVSLYGSTDALKWSKVYGLQEGFNGFAYGNAAYYDNQLKIIFEDYAKNDIKMHDLSDYIHILQELSLGMK